MGLKLINKNMINLERLPQFIHEELKYKDNVEIAYCRIVGDKFLDLKLTTKGKKNSFESGEIVNLERYKNWLRKYRDETISKIID